MQLLGAILSGIILGVYTSPFLFWIRKIVKKEISVFFEIIFLILFVMIFSSEFNSPQFFAFCLVLALTASLLIELIYFYSKKKINSRRDLKEKYDNKK